MANTSWNPADKTANATLTGSNLIVTSAAAGTNSVRAVHSQAINSFYWECTCNIIAGTNTGAGCHSAAFSFANGGYNATFTGTSGMIRTGFVYVNGTLQSGTSGGTLTNGTVIGIAVDCSAQRIWFRVAPAGNWNNSGTANPATGVGGIAITLGGATPLFPSAVMSANGDQVIANFGDSEFVGAVPAGFVSGFPTVAVPLGGTSQARAMVLA